MYLWNYPAGRISGLCSSQVTGWEELPHSLTCFSSHLGSVSLSAMGMLLLKQEDNQSASSSTGHLPTCKQVHPGHWIGQEMIQAGGPC